MIPTETKVIVEDLRLEAYVGLDDPEMNALQTIAIDITCMLAEPAVPREDITGTVDYVPVVERIRALATERKRRLIETFAEEVAEICLEDPNAGTVVVSIRKPNKFPGIQAVGVTRTFTRKES